MCTATSWNTTPAALVKRFGNLNTGEVEGHSRLMIRPTEGQVVLKPDAARALKLEPFGIVDPDPSRPKRRIVNARRENLARSPLWKSLMQGHRCVVFISAFYECRKQDGMEVFRIFEADTEGNPLPSALMGLYNDSGVVVVTRPAEGVMSDIHDRMPAVLPPEWMEEWLQGSPDTARQLVAHPAPPLQAMRITSEAFKIDPNAAELTKPARAQFRQQSLFGD